MKHLKMSSIQQLIETVQFEIEESIANLDKKRKLKVFLPAGNTCRPIYESWAKNVPNFLERIEPYQIDEILDGKSQFAQFFSNHLPIPVSKIDKGNVTCDLALLGLGLNGHVGFHEPGIDERFYSGCLPLSPSTCKNLNIPTSAWGVTYGVGAFKECKKILLIVRGSSKQEILSKCLRGAPLPGAKILELPQTQLIELEV